MNQDEELLQKADALLAAIRRQRRERQSRHQVARRTVARAAAENAKRQSELDRKLAVLATEFDRAAFDFLQARAGSGPR